jgi:hypothetical protein
MEGFGKELDSGSEEWKEFIKQMREASSALPDFSKIKSDLQDISKILQDLDFGATISEEDYKRLVEYNDEWERFFIL